MFMKKQDKAILKKVKQCDNHPLEVCYPQEKIDLTYDLRRKGCHRPKINTKHFKNNIMSVQCK